MSQEGENGMDTLEGEEHQTPRMAEQMRVPRRVGQVDLSGMQEEQGDVSGIAMVMRMLAAEQLRSNEERRLERIEAERIRREDIARQKEESARQQSQWDRMFLMSEHRRQGDAAKAETERVRLEAIRMDAEKIKTERAAERELERDKAMREHQLLMLNQQQMADERLAGANRVTLGQERKRHDALLSVPMLKEGENLQEFFLIAERRLEQGGVEGDNCVSIIASKLTGRLSLVWLDTAGDVISYQDTKEAFLRVCGFTPKIAGEAFFGFSIDQCKGLTAEQLYHKGQKLYRRLTTPVVADPELEFSLLKAWIYHLMPKRAKVAIDTRVVEKPSELIQALSDYLMLEGDRKEGVAATFRPVSFVVEKEKPQRGNCFTCGKPGHRALDCRQGKGGGDPSKSTGTDSKGQGKIICYTCHVEGHKSPQCPNRLGKEEKKKNPEGRATPLNRLRASKTAEVELPGKVNGSEVQVLLDSGADVSVVPNHLVLPGQLTGRTIWVKPFKAKVSYSCPTATVPFVLGGMQWEEEVAVDMECDESEGQILYSLDIRSERGLKLIVYANQVEEVEINRVTTRSESKDKDKQAALEVATMETEMPTVRGISGSDVSLQDSDTV